LVEEHGSKDITTILKQAMKKKEIGKFGEDLAVKHLKNKGYEICKRNHRFGKAEVDIIAQKDELLLFVEVKLRSSDDFGDPEEFVSKAQANLILNAAEEYILAVDWKKEVRFDILVIQKHEGEWKIECFEDAFH
jgi:putative endonuclease